MSYVSHDLLGKVVVEIEFAEHAQGAPQPFCWPFADKKRATIVAVYLDKNDMYSYLVFAVRDDTGRIGEIMARKCAFDVSAATQKAEPDEAIIRGLAGPGATS